MNHELEGTLRRYEIIYTWVPTDGMVSQGHSSSQEVWRMAGKCPEEEVGDPTPAHPN